MPRLLLAPAVGGKTQSAIRHIRTVLATAPLSTVWAIVPDRNQGASFQRRLAIDGALGVRVGTFGDLYAEILAEAAQPFPVTPEPVLHRLVRAAIDEVAEQGRLVYYAPIQRRPGLANVLADLFAELKRSRTTAQQLSRATSGLGPRLEELAALYEAYQSWLVRLNWSDHEGLGWLAVNALETDSAVAKRLRLVVVDGFDSFNPTQVALLEALAARVGEMLLTLTGDHEMYRLAYRRFARTLAVLDEHLSPRIEVLPERVPPVPALAHLEASLFESDAGRVPAGSSITFIEAQNTALEAREAMRWMKARIVRDGVSPARCAIVARDIGRYRLPLREAAREFGLPLRLACGEPLPSNPAVASVLNLLALPIQHWARRPLLDVLRTPYVDRSRFGFSAGAAAELDEIARAGQVIAGMEQWREAILLTAGGDDSVVEDVDDEEGRPPRWPMGAAAVAYWESLRTFAERLTPPARGTLAAYAQWVESLLAEQEGLRLASCIAAQPDTAARDGVACDAFFAALGALVLGESVVGHPFKLSYEEFYAELRALIDASSYRLDDAANVDLGHIYATSVSGARGVCYRAVAVLGLSEGLFPTPLLEDPLVSDEERESLVARRQPLEPRLRSDQQTLFYEGVTRATEYLLLARPYLAEDGETWQASPYWWAVHRLFDAPIQRIRPEDVRAHVDAASPAELLAWCVRRRSLPGKYGELQQEWERVRHGGNVLRARLESEVGGEYEGETLSLRSALTERYSPQHVWSATRLEAYGACPYRFFATYALGLEERKLPEPGFDAAQLGLMLHEVLERVYRHANDPTSLEDLLAALPIVAEPIFDAAPQKYGFRPGLLWDTEQQELLDCLARTLTGLAEGGGSFRPAHFELAVGLGGTPPLVIETDEGPVLLRGIIDRIDLDAAGNVRVIDYKTGSSGLGSRDLCEGRRLQLAIYALAAEDCLRLGKPVDGFYWAIRSGAMGQLQLQRFRYELEGGQVYAGVRGAIEIAVEHVTTFLRQIREGVFTPAPPAGGCAGYCPPRLFCWRYQPARW